MALEKRGKFYRYEFMWKGEIIRKATRLTNEKLARTAERHHRERLALLDMGVPLPPELVERPRLPALSEYIPTFLAWSKMFHRPATFRLHRSNCRALERHLGDLRLNEINRAAVEKFMVARACENPTNVVRHDDGSSTVKELDGELSPCSVNRAVTTLRLLYRQAQGEWKQLENPCRGGPGGIQMLEEPEPQYILTENEFKRYLQVSPLDLAHAAVLMRERGLRPQDVVNLRPRDVDLLNEVIELWPAPEPGRRRQRTSGGKTDHASRPIVMTPAMREVLEERLRMAGANGTRYLFPMRDWRGRLMGNRHRSTNSLGKAHRGARRRAGLPEGVRLYDLRHTFATCAARGRVNQRAIAGVLGHSTLEMSKRYTRFDVELQRAAFQPLEAKKNA